MLTAKPAPSRVVLIWPFHDAVARLRVLLEGERDEAWASACAREGAGEAGADPLGSRPCQPQAPEAAANPGRSFGKGSCASLPAAEAVNTLIVPVNYQAAPPLSGQVTGLRTRLWAPTAAMGPLCDAARGPVSAAQTLVLGLCCGKGPHREHACSPSRGQRAASWRRCGVRAPWGADASGSAVGGSPCQRPHVLQREPPASKLLCS